MKQPIAFTVLFFLVLVQGAPAAPLTRRTRASVQKIHNKNNKAPRNPRAGPNDSKNGGRPLTPNGKTAQVDKRKPQEPPVFLPIQPLLRGEFHRFGALCYPLVLGLPLFLRSQPQHRRESLLFSVAVEGIMVVSSFLHTFPWQHHQEDWYQVARKADFAMIFVGIALFYSSIGKLLLGSTSVVFNRVIEPLVWVCAAIGAISKWFFPDAPPWFNAMVFLIQGWAIGPLVPQLFQSATLPEASGLVLGGIFISLGALAYSVRWPDGHWVFHPDVFGPHEMFHVGTLFMFLSFWSTMWVRVAR